MKKLAIMDKFAVKVTAKKIRKQRVLFKIASVVTLITFSVLLLAFVASNFVNKAGNFTVDVKKYSDQSKIAIADNIDFNNQTVFLKAGVLDQMDNITEDWIDKGVNGVDGSHNGENYIAYTFYLKNKSDHEIGYSEEISVSEVTKNADEAIRVKVFRNDDMTVYAKRSKDGVNPENGTTPFFSDTKVCNNQYDHLAVDEVVKYTVVIWLEGNDPDCIDDILGGSVKLAMHFKTI